MSKNKPTTDPTPARLETTTDPPPLTGAAPSLVNDALAELERIKRKNTRILIGARPPGEKSGIKKIGLSEQESAVILATLLAQKVPPVANENDKNETLPQYVTLDKIAAMVGRKKKTLERALNKPDSDMPRPDIEGGGGKPHEWIWTRIRPWLEKNHNRSLPERLPSWNQAGRH
jgi:hypothetical protein